MNGFGGRRLPLQLFAGAVFLTWGAAILLYAQQMGSGTNLLDWLYAASVLFVGTFTATASAPDLWMKVVRLLAFGLSSVAVLALVSTALRRWFDTSRGVAAHDHVVIVGDGAPAEALAADYRRTTSRVVLVRWRGAWTPGRLSGVREVVTEDVRLLGHVLANASRVVVLLDDDGEALRVREAVVRSRLGRGCMVHIGLRSPEVAAASVLRKDAFELVSNQVDSFAAVERVIATSVLSPNRAVADRIVVVGDGELAVAVAVHAIDGFSLVDTAGVECVGLDADQTATRVAARRPGFASVTSTVVPRIDPIALRHLVAGDSRSTVIVCPEDDTLAILWGAAFGRIFDGSADVVSLVRGPKLGRSDPAHGVRVVSMQDELGLRVIIERDRFELAARWSLRESEVGFAKLVRDSAKGQDAVRLFTELVQECATRLESLGFFLVPGAEPAVLAPRELRELAAVVRGRLWERHPADRSVPEPDLCDHAALAWSAQLPFWLARAGLGTLRRDAHEPVGTLGDIEGLAAAVHERYWRGLQPFERVKRQRQGQTLAYDRLPEDKKVANRAQAWHFAVYLAWAGWDIGRLGEDGVADLSSGPGFVSGDAVRFLAEREHERWMVERMSSGWVPPGDAPGFRSHPDLTGWDALDPTEQQKDVDAIGAIPWVLKQQKLGLRGPTSMDGARCALARAARFRPRPRDVDARQLEEPTTWTTRCGDVMTGEAGDWLLTDADGSSRTVSDERFRATYTESASGRWQKCGEVRAIPAGAQLTVPTMEGPATAHAGDWVVQDVTDDTAVWPVPADEFARRYVAVAVAGVGA